MRFLFYLFASVANPFLIATDKTAFVEGTSENEFACLRVEPHFGVVGFAIVRVEDGATLEFTIAPFHFLYIDDANDWFVVEFAFAGFADFVFFAFDENALNLSVIETIGTTIDVDD